MFNKLRRPVPSKAALKVLYQLAYISSGTAVGIATLCTEERRRQAKIVQKIADNAKRIRQSPRYVHNAAAAVRRDGFESSRQGLMQDGPVDQVDTEQGLVDQKRKRRPVRDSDLPTAVDRGYEQLALRDYKRTRRRRALAQGTEAEAISKGLRSDNIHSPPKPTSSSGVVRRIDVSKGLMNVYAMQQRPYRLKLVEQVEEKLDEEVPVRFRHLLMDPSKESSFEQRTSRSTTPQSISRDMKLFYQKQPWSSNGTTESKVASALLFNAIESGTLQEITSLHQWLYTRDAIQPQHLVALCDACLDLAEKFDHRDLFDFYKHIFETDDFRGLETKERMRHLLVVADETTSWNLDLTVAARFKRLLQTQSDAKPKDILDVVQELVEELLHWKDAPRANRLLMKVMLSTFRRNKPRHQSRLRELQDSIFVSALEHGQLLPASRHFDHLLRFASEQSLPYLEKLALACTQHNSYTALSRLLSHEITRSRIDGLAPQLSHTAKFAIAKACIVDQKRLLSESLFDQLYSVAPAEHRDILAEARTTRLLQDQWKSTRDFSATWDTYVSARDFAIQNDEQELRNATDAVMIDICNAANRPDQALELLSDLNQRAPQSSRTMSMAAMSLARKNSWRRVTKLIGLMETSGTFTQDSIVSKCFDSIIRQFAHWHSPADLWSFVTNLVERLRFVPSRKTTQIVLRAFVRRKHLSFVSHWIRYLKTTGVPFEMDARTAASLMNAYYLDQRPPHVLIIWFCRRITRLVPSFDAAAFERVMTEAIGYDLRNGKAELREQAKGDLDVLQRSEGLISKPVSDFGDLSPNDPALASKPLNDEGREDDLLPWKQSSSDTLFPKISAPTIPHGLARNCTADNFTPDTPTSTPSYPGMETYGVGDSVPLQNVGNEILGHHSEVSVDLTDLEANLQPKHAYENRRQQVQREMITAFSLHDYNQVLEIYLSSRSPNGLPVSTKALEITVEASLRLHRDDRTEAEGIMAQAGKAGMDVSCAMQPLLLHHMRQLNADDKHDVNRLRLMVMDWYRANEANGLPVNNHIGVTAASILVNNHRPEYAINLLTDLSQSDWIRQRPFDIVAMTVFLKAYAAMKSAKGIKWTIATVLRKNMRIDRRFVDAIKECSKHFEVSGIGKPSKRPNRLRGRLRQWRLICARRRIQQRQETKVFGRNLVKFIAKLAKESHRPMIDTDVRKELDSQLFGASHSDVVAPTTIPPKSRQQLRRARAQVARDIRWDQGPRHEGQRTADITRDVVWLKQYRAFLRRDIVMLDGKIASFRYRLANVPRRKYRRAREPRPVQTAQTNESMVDEHHEKGSRLNVPPERTRVRYEPHGFEGDK